jgi:hypothetical protein
MNKLPKDLSYYVVQEGGTSQELYLSAFKQKRDAERYRKSAAKGSYRTSPVGLANTKMLDHMLNCPSSMSDLFEFISELNSAAQEVDYP